ncbi:DMT family transporter [Bosea sp. Root483D1]|uniref:DMT family transporter n=1 Tax=Bosea sp. Root483D1 TaxID=1736544 RepID=UPI000A8FDE1C|nr:DMT family transporter [Bosea sp. Root483D1]
MTASPDQTHHKRRDETLGVLLMAAAMLIIPTSDAIAKYLSGAHSPAFLSWVRYVAALGFILPVALFWRGQQPAAPLASPRRYWLSHILRTAFLVTAMTLYFVAITRIPLADALGAYFIAPIAATLLASITLRERLDRRKLLAVALGFVGAILVVRPGAETSADTLIALASGICMACYLVLTRATAQSRSPVATLTIQLILGILMLMPFALLQWTTPTREGLLLILLMGLVSTFSNLMTISAFRLAPVATLSPLVYLELIGATALGFALFGDLPSPTTWAGIAVIVAAGLIVATARPATRRLPS